MSDSTSPATPATLTDAVTPTPHAQLTHYLGLDWGKNNHQATVVDPAGHILLDLDFPDSAEGWALLRKEIQSFPRLGVAIETSRGPALERLLALGLTVFPLNPKAAERYRDRKRPSGPKSDKLDGWCFADALRTDGRDWRPLRPQDPVIQEMRMLCRDEIALIEQRTALVNQLQAALHEYHAVVLRAFEDWTSPTAWDFVIAFPTPEALAQAGKRKWQNFLHAHKLYRPSTAEKRLALFATAGAFLNPNATVTAAKSLLAVALAEQLRVLQRSLDKYRERIQALFKNHPDHDIFDSLPGAGPKLAPRLLAEIGANREVFPKAEDLKAYAGTAPVTIQSGKTKFVRLRQACNKTLRATVHYWANLSRATCVWAQTFYESKKGKGMGHAAILRALGNRWLEILIRMWHDRVPYDEARHLKNLVASGAYAVELLQPKAKQATT